MELWFDEVGVVGGPTVVLLPDASTPAVAWPADLLEGLMAARCRVIRVDLADQGRSTTGPAGSFGELVEAVALVVEQVGGVAGAVTLVGHGFGGTLALALTQARPGAVSQLLMVSSTGWYADPTVAGPDEAVVVGLIWRNRMGLNQQHPQRALARELRLAWPPDGAPSRDELLAEAERWHDWGWNPRDDHRVLWLAAPPLWSAMAQVSCPVAVLHGALDPIVPVDHGRRLAALCPSAAYVELSGSAHALDSGLVGAILAVVAP